MKRFLAATAFSCAIILSAIGVLMAGALDRQNAMPRSNPVIQSMIRVPGVVGQEQMPAMSAIQQAGLNVSVLAAKKLPKGLSGADGMEGKVVSQTPAPGGMAMYGTTVTIYVWKPTPNAAATESAAGAASWGTGYSSPSSSLPAFPGSSQGTGVQGQQAYPQSGTPMQQSSQPFQVQQYYYPGAGGYPQDGTTGQQGVPPQDQQQSQPPMDPNMSQQDGAQQPAAAPPAQ